MAENDIIVPKENASGGFDEIALTAADISADSLFDFGSQTLSGTGVTLSASRARIWTLICFNATTVTLPTTGVEFGDRIVLRGGSPVSATISISSTGVSDTITASGQQISYVYTSTGSGPRWVKNFVDAHTHTASEITDLGTAATADSTDFAPAVNVIELTPSPGSTTITTSQLPARGIAYIEGGGSFTVNLPTPDKRQSGLTFSIKVEHEGASGDVFITVVHNASDLLTGYELDEDESSLDFLWDGYRWTYSSANWLYSYPNRRLVIPPLSGTLGLSEPADNVFRVVGSADATKKLAFEVDTNVPTTSTVALTVPAASGTIALTAQLTDTQIFTSNGTWTKPAGAKLVHYLLIGGGGGGGAGRRNPSTNSLGGGGGGAGGGITAGYVDPAFLGSTESITVGAGGAGAADSADNTNGATGSAGGDSSLGSFIKAKGGAAGGGGTFAAGASGAATTLASLFYGTNASTAAGAAGGSSSAAPNNAAASVYLPTGGGGGGGRGSSTNGVGSKGGDIGQTNTGVTSAPAIAAATNGPAGIRSQSSYAGTGGGGGSMSSDNAVLTGFSGGAGGLYGGGGGGGSGAGNAAGGSSAGGTGGAGIVIVTTYF